MEILNLKKIKILRKLPLKLSKLSSWKSILLKSNNTKLCFYIFTVGNLQNFFMEHDLNIQMIFGIQEKLSQVPYVTMVPRGNETLRQEMLKGTPSAIPCSESYV